MNLRKEVVIGIVLILVIFILYYLIDFWQSSSEKTNIEDFIKEDLMSKHPDADEIEILEMEKKHNEEGGVYYFIKAKVTEGLYTPCPVRIHYYYNYPEQNFITQPAEYITNDCKVCEVEPCVLSFKEEAIIASHTLEGTEAVQEFINNNSDAYPIVEKLENEWKVTWMDGEYNYEVHLSFKGEVLSINQVAYTE